MKNFLSLFLFSILVFAVSAEESSFPVPDDNSVVTDEFLRLLNGSDYYIFQMDKTTFGKLESEGKVVSDMRSHDILDENPTRIDVIWNPFAEIAEAPQSGLNSFSLAESWYSIAAASPTPDGCWGNICGGLGITAATDPEVGKLQNLTSDHVFVVVLKGAYTPANYLTITMTPPAGGDNVTLFKVTDSTGENNDGDWEVFTLTYSDLVNLGIDLSQPITAETWYPWAYMANGAGNRVDVDCVFFYVPEKSTSVSESAAVQQNVTAKNGRIYSEEPFKIFNLAGQDVTSLNGNLQGTYLVAVGGETVKINVD